MNEHPLISHDQDLALLQDCLAGAPFGWQKLCDRFLPDVSLVIRQTANIHGVKSDEELESLALSFFHFLARNDLDVLRRFQEQSSLSTYLAVICRRWVVEQQEQVKRT